MRRTLARTAGALALVLLSLVPLAAQRTAEIRGRVADARGAPVANARVTVRGTAHEARTGPAGEYRIGGVAAGTYTVAVAAADHAGVARTVAVADAAALRLDFVLPERSVALEGLRIVGSRARHDAASELAVPVDVFPAEELARQGTVETAQILANLSPSVNFPRQSVSDATEIVRPFTLRGLSPDHTLVLLNGRRYHRTALVHVFGAGMGAGSSGVDLNTLPSTAFERIEVLRDGAAAQYGSDAIAGVVNLVMRRGAFRPSLTVDAGQHAPDEWRRDGRSLLVGGSAGIPVGLGSIALFGEVRDRAATNRAGADPEDQLLPGDADSIADGRVVDKRNGVPQPTYHWGDGRSRDWLGFVNASFPLSARRQTEAYAFGGYAFRRGSGNGYFRHGMDTRNWPQIHPLGFLPEFRPDVKDATAAAGLRGTRSGWNWDVGATWGRNAFAYNLRNTLNTSLGPCLDAPCAPGLDGVLGNADDPGIPNRTAFFAGELRLDEAVASLDASREVALGLRAPVNVAVGAAWRRERYEVVQGEPASWLQGGHPDRFGDPAPSGSQVFPGFRPEDASTHTRDNLAAYLEMESALAPRLLASAAARFEDYTDFGGRLTGKLALRVQASDRLTLRGAASTGFRAPSLSQSHFSSSVTNFRAGEDGTPEAFTIGIFPVGSPAARLLGARPLHEETSVNLSAGLAWSPLPGLDVTVDAYRVTVDDRILLTTYLGTDSVTALLRGAGLEAEAGQYFTNAVDTRTQGLDVTAGWRTGLGGERLLELTGDAGWTRTRVTNRPIPLPAELQGTGASLLDEFGEGGLLAMEKERPAWRGTLTAVGTAGAWSLLARESLYGGYTSALYGYCEACAQEYPAKGLFDLELGYRVGGGRLSVGARNLFDTFPAKMREDNSFGVFLYPPASPFGYNGRYVYTRLELRM